MLMCIQTMSGERDMKLEKVGEPRRGAQDLCSLLVELLWHALIYGLIVHNIYNSFNEKILK